MADPISLLFKDSVNDAELVRLKAAGYMSPQAPQFVGLGFACASCDWYQGHRKGLPAELHVTGRCTNPNVNSKVEHQGCCNLYQFKGVHSIPGESDAAQ